MTLESVFLRFDDFLGHLEVLYKRTMTPNPDFALHDAISFTWVGRI